MNILVTGATGYLGSKIIEVLLDNPSISKIVAIYRNEEKFEQLRKNLNHNNKHMHKLIGDKCDLDKIDTLDDYYAVIHCAAYRNIRSCIQDPIETIKSNVILTQRLVNLVKKSNIPRFIFISSQSIYGCQNENIITENFKPNPLNLYSFTKLTGEEFVRHTLENSKTKYVIARCARLFGKGIFNNADNILTTKFPKDCIINKELKITGNGLQSFDIIDVHDVATFVEKALFCSEAYINDCYNVGCGKSISLKNIADVFVQASRELGIGEVSIKFEGDYVSSEANGRYLDVEKAYKNIGWKPSKDYYKSIYETLENFNEGNPSLH